MAVLPTKRRSKWLIWCFLLKVSMVTLEGYYGYWPKLLYSPWLSKSCLVTAYYSKIETRNKQSTTESNIINNIQSKVLYSCSGSYSLYNFLVKHNDLFRTTYIIKVSQGRVRNSIMGRLKFRFFRSGLRCQ